MKRTKNLFYKIFKNFTPSHLVLKIIKIKKFRMIKKWRFLIDKKKEYIKKYTIFEKKIFTEQNKWKRNCKIPVKAILIFNLRYFALDSNINY